MSIPYKVLEININSANDLPPVSKMLRTFVVAWVNPDNKLTTKVDHQGHTNPTWNYKFLFRVDDNFLRSETSVVMIEIYNVAWLRDLPIGTTRLTINQIRPLIANKNSSTRSIALHIRRPSGHLKGILNVSVNLIGNNIEIPSPTNDSSLSPMSKLESLLSDNDRKFDLKDIEDEKFESLLSDPDINFDLKEMENEKFEHENSPIRLKRSKSARIQPSEEDISPLRSIIWSQSSPEKSQVMISSNNGNSFYSSIKPFSTEKASKLRRTGSYTPSIGSSIFDNWTVASASEYGSKPKHVERQLNELANDHWIVTASSETSSKSKSTVRQTNIQANDHWTMTSASETSSKSKGVERQMNVLPIDQWTVTSASETSSKSKGVGRQMNVLAIDHGDMNIHRPRRKHSSKKKGLFSCIGNAYGFQFTFTCGSKKNKKGRNKKHEPGTFPSNLPKENLRPFYI